MRAQVTATDERVGVDEMAKAWGVSRWTARRRMLAIEAERPGAVYRGPRGEVRSTATAMAPFVKGPRGTNTPLEREVRRLREELEDEKRQKDQLVREVRELRDLVNREFRRRSSVWFRGGK